MKRCLTVIASLLLLALPAMAQYATNPPPMTPMTQLAPVVVSPMTIDPYAMGTVLPANTWSGGMQVPTRESIRGRVWYRIEYLLWWPQGMNTPPLATSSAPGTSQGQAGVLGQPDTALLFGGHDINDGSTSGLRTRSGYWFRGGRFAFESELFALSANKDAFIAESDGSIIFARPYFNILTGSEASQLTSFPDIVGGRQVVRSKSQLGSIMFTGRGALAPGSTDPCGYKPTRRIDWIMGYRHLDLEDRLVFNDAVTSLVPAADSVSTIDEGFETRNRFNGFQLGAIYQANFPRGWVEARMRVALGGTNQRVRINGGTLITENGTTTPFVGGLLTQRTNIGVFERDKFTMIPELGMTFGLRARDWFHATFGYSVLYFPNVVRAGDQIDRDLNPTLFPPEIAFAGALRPRFRYIESDYWAHGFNIGAELRY